MHRVVNVFVEAGPFEQHFELHFAPVALRFVVAFERTGEVVGILTELAVEVAELFDFLFPLVGLYGLLFEFMNPGFVAPGVIGGVCLLLALWGLQMLPINYAGLALILLGIAFFVGEAFVPSFGALGVGGVAAFAFGALLLIDGDAPGFEIPLAMVGALTLLSAVERTH